MSLFTLGQVIILTVQVGDAFFSDQVGFFIQREKIDIRDAGIGQEEIGQELLDDTDRGGFAI